jgi:hypothetical protein
MSKLTRLPDIDPEGHWRLAQRTGKLFARFLQPFLAKTPAPLHHEALRLIADDCWARMEALEHANKTEDETTSVN